MIYLFLTSITSRGTSGIDVDLRRVDIDQCSQRRTVGGIAPLNIFAGTDKCKQQTTEVSNIPIHSTEIFSSKTHPSRATENERVIKAHEMGFKSEVVLDLLTRIRIDANADDQIESKECQWLRPINHVASLRCGW